MAARKLPYYRMESSLMPFRPIRWQHYAGSRGCVPLATQSAVSLERPAPGATPLPPPPPPPPESRQAAKARKAQERLQKRLDAAAANKQADSKPPERADGLVLEECKEPPVFDLQDIPGAMEMMGWPISAKFARMWFNGQKHVYDNDPNSVQPIVDSVVTLDWVLQFGNVRKKLTELLGNRVYSIAAKTELKRILHRHLNSVFLAQRNLSFTTERFLSDLRQFHINWQFQHLIVSEEDTLTKAWGITDLTGALANFNLYAAIADATVSGEKYFKYNNLKKTKTLCQDPRVAITHLFVYVKDNYSFNEGKGSQKSQYLGHWNSTGAIITSGGLVSQVIDGRERGLYKKMGFSLPLAIHTDLGNSPEDRSRLHFPYLTNDGLELVVDTREGMLSKYRKADVYFPIFNKTYNEWREKHQRGGDFMIYSSPVRMKLNRPIYVELDTICRPPEPMY